MAPTFPAGGRLTSSDDGFREFVQVRRAWLSRVAYLPTGDHHAAEDLLQSALVSTARRAFLDGPSPHTKPRKVVRARSAKHACQLPISELRGGGT